MKETISLEELTINEDGSFSIPSNTALEKTIREDTKGSLNGHCRNSSSCGSTDNFNCRNTTSCDGSSNLDSCQNPTSQMF